MLKFYILIPIILLFFPVLHIEHALAEEKVTIAAVGDIMLGSIYPEPVLPPQNGGNVLDAVDEYLIGHDIVMGNLEGVLADEGTTTKDISSGRSFAFRMPAYFGKSLKDAGFNFLSLANNHAGDFGNNGMASTIKIITEEGIHYSGPSAHIAYMDVKGLKIAIIAFAPYTQFFNLLDVSASQDVIQRLADENDIVIVSMHIGSEGSRALKTRDTLEYLYNEPRGNPIAFAHAAIDAGADLIIGHGPHVPRAMELYKERLIAYSLGNFCTYGYFNLKGEGGLSQILTVDINNQGRFLSGGILSLIQEGKGVPAIDNDKRTAKLVKRLSKEDFPGNTLIFDEAEQGTWIQFHQR